GRAGVRGPGQQRGVRPRPASPAAARRHRNPDPGRPRPPRLHSDLPAGPAHRPAAGAAQERSPDLPPGLTMSATPYEGPAGRLLEGHAGDHARAVLDGYGVDTMWTL